MSKRALITSWNQNYPFHCEHVTYRQNLRCFLSPIRWPRQATCNKTKKLTFSLEATKFCLVLRSTSAVLTQNCFQAANQYSFARKNKFLFKLRLKRETNLMQARSANQHQVIMPSWLRKNALCLSQSALSNIALHVIKNVKREVSSFHHSQPFSFTYAKSFVDLGRSLTPAHKG